MAQDHEPTVAALGMQKTESTWRGEEGSVSCLPLAVQNGPSSPSVKLYGKRERAANYSPYFVMKKSPQGLRG